MIQFYAPDIESNPYLPEGEAGHCIRVLRKREGDEITVIDGNGNRYLCEIEEADPRKAKVRILKKEHIASDKNYKLILAVAPTKNSDRMEWMVEKCVEIGVDEIVLLKCDRSERKNLRGDRLQKIAVSAMKQSLATRCPKITDTLDFKDFIAKYGAGSQKFFGYCDPNILRREFVKECEAGKDVTVMIGPEGDFTEEEVNEAMRQGFLPVTFGEKRLRTETAGVFVATAVEVLNQLAE